MILGPILFFGMLLMPTPAGMSPSACKTAAVALLMASWWICESVPIPVTSLLPIPLFPLLGVMSTPRATAPYANHLIFLFMGGFIIALSMQRWNLHRRIAMTIVRRVGFSPGRLIFGFMLATALLSAFVSNTATAVMMMPIGLAIIQHSVQEARREGLAGEVEVPSQHLLAFGLDLMLGIAYAASIGGIATLIGTPPNTVLASYLQKAYGYEITFRSWLKVGLPLAATLLPLTWLWLTRVANPIGLKRVPGGVELIDRELRRMGPMGAGERWTLLVFVLTGLAWIFRPQWAGLFPEPKLITDATIAMAGAAVLFMIPLDLKRNLFVMDWHWAQKLPWGVLILFGGGLALADGFKDSGLAVWIGQQVGLLDRAPVWLVILAVTTLIVLLTEMTSNTATAAMSMPLLAAVAIGMGQSPVLLVVPAAIASSCAFMLPVATPPNAIVFGSGYVSIPQMARSGLGLNVISIALIVLLTFAVVIPVFGVQLGHLPAWVSLPK
jgi:sodium-dependent dicarboxylate transporter 2/3/5